jgi:hypothetical protein
MTTTEHLTPAEEGQLLALIEASIIARYSGDLKRHEDLRMKRGDTYTPLDTGAIRNLLTTLWDGPALAEITERALETLTKHGAKEWPRAWCDDHLDDDERWEKLDGIEQEIDRVEELLANLKRQHNSLNYSDHTGEDR